jgi:DNA-directed RNA polymerase specialized sigma subunit
LAFWNYRTNLWKADWLDRGLPLLINDALQLIDEAAQGDRDAVERVFKSLKVQLALRMLFDSCSPQGALVAIGRFYGGLTVRELGRIFKISHQHISNIEKEVSNKIEQQRR